MIIRISLIFAVTVCGSILAHGQELWLRPDQYFVAPGATVRVSLQTGGDFIAEPVAFQRENVESLHVTFKTTRVDIRRNFQDGEKASFTFDALQEGIHQYLMKTNSQERSMKYSEFQEFARQYGLEDLNADSTTTDSVMVEKSHYIKGYVRAGKAMDKRPEHHQSLPLEVLADRNPLGLNRGDRITFTVYKNGKPAFGVRVKIWNRWDNRTTIQHIYTQQDGTVSTTVSSPGDWMVSVVDLRATDRKNYYIGDAFNLTFGYR